MSPASSGALEVERYIGACLISSQGRPKSRDQHQQLVHDVYPGGYVNVHQQRCAVDGWAGGMPLISFMSQRRRRPELQDNRSSSPRVEENNLSRLAIHTQGAPLILSGRYNNHNRKKEQRTSTTPVRQDCPRNAKFNVQRRNNGHARVSDSISVASDESSGSANSENCLPRIIKPRKRRKKDRKPPHLTRVDSLSSTSNSPEIEPYRDEPVYFCDFVNACPVDVNNAVHGGEVVNRSANDLGYGIVKGDPVIHKGEEAPKLHHSFEEVEGSDEASPGDTSSCQCRYCDPSGQIWDVDRRCYSPFLTLPSLNNYHLFTFNSAPAAHECLVEKMSNVSLNNSPVSKSHLGDLEVSTEIVTSLNGHRDLEIKFFSSTASAAELTARTMAADAADNVTNAENKNSTTCVNYSDNANDVLLLTVEE